MDALVERFYEELGSGAVLAGVRDRLAHFSTLDYHLTLAANDTENFWQGI